MANKRKVIDFEAGCALVQGGITKLKNLLKGVPEQPFVANECSVLYTTIFNMCTQPFPHNHSSQLYHAYAESFKDYIHSKVLPPLREKHNEFLLKELVNRWENHKVMMHCLSRHFNFLDRYFTSREKLPRLYHVGLMAFHDLVHEEMKGNVKDAVIALIDREREGEQIDCSLLKNVLAIFVVLGMGTLEAYESDFETFMLQAAGGYYSRKAACWIAEDSCPEYMVKAEECLMRERERVVHYLHASSEQKLVVRVQHEVLSQYEIQLLENEHSGCDALLRDGKVEDLSRMCRLFGRIPKGLEPVASIFRQHATDEGTALVKQAEDASHKVDAGGQAQAQDFVQKVIELHDKHLHYIHHCFVKHSLFHKALKEAFEVFCNKSVAGSNTAELLATFCDILLKKGGSDEAIEDALEKVVKVVTYVNDKDLFMEFHRKKLARRLLFEKNHANYDHERSLLTKLKQECGAQFTSKMEGMLMDMTLALENQTLFEEYLMTRANLSVEFTVTVLSSGFWPSYKSSNLVVPAEMVKCSEVFKEFYATKTRNQKLTLIYSLGTCNMIGRFDTKPIDLIVTTYQAAVLLLFNNEERMSYRKIKTELNLIDEDVIRLLHSLSCAKYQVLKKDPSSKIAVSRTDTFEFNSKFTDKMRRVKIPLPPMDEKKVVVDVDKDRCYAVDAAVVRIMKSRKRLSHQQLVMECVEQCWRMFKPDAKLIKKRIEDLLTRDFLERDVNNPNVYKYVA